MYRRLLETPLLESARRFPVVTLTGPRQSGKTTLARAAFPGHAYVSLENPDVRSFALRDPRGFLASTPAPAIFDEIQRAPDLVSYLQGIVDERPTPGGYILTGSQNLLIAATVSQSLAGRTALHTLLPLGLEESPLAEWRGGLESLLHTGGYPAIHDRGIPPGEWHSTYLETYVERDVRDLRQVGDLEAFRLFIKLAAGRAAQELNLSELGADAGISQPTARAWLGILEAGYLVFRVPAWHGNIRKRLVRRPKLYFHDTGLVCALLGIEEPRQLVTHPLRGAIFENLVAAEQMKYRANRGRRSNLSHFRDRRGLEIDLIQETAEGDFAIEAKSGATVASDWFDALEAWRGMLHRPPDAAALVYGGGDFQRRSRGFVAGWRRMTEVMR